MMECALNIVSLNVHLPQCLSGYPLSPPPPPPPPPAHRFLSLQSFPNHRRMQSTLISPSAATLFLPASPPSTQSEGESEGGVVAGSIAVSGGASEASERPPLVLVLDFNLQVRRSHSLTHSYWCVVIISQPYTNVVLPKIRHFQGTHSCALISRLPPPPLELFVHPSCKPYTV